MTNVSHICLISPSELIPSDHRLEPTPSHDLFRQPRHAVVPFAETESFDDVCPRHDVLLVAVLADELMQAARDIGACCARNERGDDRDPGCELVGVVADDEARSWKEGVVADAGRREKRGGGEAGFSEVGAERCEQSPRFASAKVEAEARVAFLLEDADAIQE